MRSLARLSHPNIVQFYHTDVVRTDPYFTMEYVSGGSLHDRLRTGTFSPTEAATIIRDVARAVGVAHANDVLHRDLKPNNILITADGTPKVSDFGLARLTDQDGSLTPGSGALGTPGFMPPEQVSRRHGAIGPAADVYSLGATLFCLLTGRAPYIGPDKHEVMGRLVRDPAPRVRALRADVPAALEAIVVRCLEKQPEHRYVTADALAEDIQRFLNGQKTIALIQTWWRRARRWVTRHRRLVVGAGAVVVLATGLVWVGYLAARPALQTVEQPDLPANPWQGLEGELARPAGPLSRPIVLVGKIGRPQRFHWKVSEGVLTTSSTQDGTTAVVSHEAAFLELVRDPRHDHYQVIAQFRHLDGLPNGADVGLYCGFVRIAGPDGASVYSAVLARYSEILDENESRATGRPLVHHIGLRHGTIHCAPGSTPLIHRTTGTGRTGFPFTPKHGHRNIPWRTLVLDVSPDGVRLAVAADDDPSVVFDPDGLPTPTGLKFASKATVAEIVAERVRVQRDAIQLFKNPVTEVPVWHPRLPLGIWVNSATVSVRNVSIRPISPPPPLQEVVP